MSPLMVSSCALVAFAVACRPGGNQLCVSASPDPPGVSDPLGAPSATPGPAITAQPTPYIIGHRGAPLEAPENTLPSFDVAASIPGVWLETDVRYSLDHVPVLLHDETTDRTTGTAGAVAFMALREIEALNASAVLPGFSPTKIPTLDEYLDRYPDSPLFPEVKAGSGVPIAQLLKRHGATRRAAVQSFSADALVEVHATASDVALVLATGELPNIATLDGCGTDLWAVAPPYAAITREWIAAVHALGKKVIPYTVDRLAAAEALINVDGADGFYTNNPRYMRKFLNAYSPQETVPTPDAATLRSMWMGVRYMDGTLALRDGWVTFAGANSRNARQQAVIFPGVRTPDVPYIITTTVKVVQVASPWDATRSIGVRLGTPTTDVPSPEISNYSGPRGYYFIYRANGDVEGLRITNDAYTILARQSGWPPYAEGAEIPLKLDVMPTTITLTLIGTDRSIRIEDSTHPRDGFFSVLGSGHVPGVQSITVSYPDAGLLEKSPAGGNAKSVAAISTDR